MTPAEVADSFNKFIRSLPFESPVAVIGHSDTDGLAATVLITRALERRGFRVTADVTRKGESAWSASTLERLAASAPAALVVADLGSRNQPLLPGVPTLLIDHHRPTGVPDGATLITAYGEATPATSGLLAHWCDPDASGEWIAAVSVLADLADTSAFAEWERSRKRYGTTKLREAATLLNAPRRAASGDGTGALRLLLRSSDPSDLLAHPEAEGLRAAKQEYDAALSAARRVGPKFLAGGSIALISVNTPCQVHPALAQMWSSRLRKNIVIAANSGFLPEKVNFSMRTRTDVNLLDFLARYKPEGAGEEYGRGHDRATGGSLLFDQWNAFVEALA